MAGKLKPFRTQFEKDAAKSETNSKSWNFQNRKRSARELLRGLRTIWCIAGQRNARFGLFLLSGPLMNTDEHGFFTERQRSKRRKMEGDLGIQKTARWERSLKQRAKTYRTSPNRGVFRRNHLLFGAGLVKARGC
jgi:hypothetical protein